MDKQRIEEIKALIKHAKTTYSGRCTLEEWHGTMQLLLELVDELTKAVEENI